MGSVALGVVGLRWGDFAAVWQPVPEGVPGRTLLAYGAAVLLLIGGTALPWRGAAKPAALALAALYSLFAMLWMARIMGSPQIIGTWSGCAEQLALVVGAVAIFACLQPPGSPRAIRMALASRVIFGLCTIAFGLVHFLGGAETAAMFPKWLPPSGPAWVIATGAGQLLAGVALISGFQALLATRLFTAAFVVFGVLVWIPDIFVHPDSFTAWAGAAINLALVGAAWAIADSIADFSRGSGGAGLRFGFSLPPG